MATRYDRLATNDLAFVQLASIRLWLAARYESTPLVEGLAELLEDFPLIFGVPLGDLPCLVGT